MQLCVSFLRCACFGECSVVDISVFELVVEFFVNVSDEDYCEYVSESFC